MERTDLKKKVILPFGDGRMDSKWKRIKHRLTKDERRVPVNYESFVMRDNGLFLYEDRDRWRVLAATV